MMYFKLMRIFLKENFSFRRLLGVDLKKSKGKAILLVVVLLYSLGAFLFTFGYMFFDLGKVLAQANLVEMLLMYLFMYVFSISIMMVLFRANGYLFRYKDYEILEPLPIPHRTVLFAKATVMLIMIYVGIIVFVLPIGFAYFYHSGFSFVGLLFFLIAFPFLPLLTTIVFSLVSMLIARLTSRFRKSNILNIILMLAVFIGVSAFFMSMNFSEDQNPLLNQQGFIKGLGEIYIPMMWFVEAVHNHDVISLIMLIAVSAIPFYLFLILIQPLSLTTNQKGVTIVTRKNSKPAKSQARPLFETLVIKEVRKFFSIPIYAVNAGLGPLLLLILGILSLVYKNKIMSFMSETVGLPVSIEIVVAIVVLFCLATVYTSAISLSLEGKNLWIIKSLPIKPQQIMNAKLTFNVLLGLPFAYFALVLISISFQFSLVDFLVLMLLATTFSLMISAIDSFVNLQFPKFEFMSDTEVVKQSVGAMVGILGGMAMIALNGVIFYFMDKAIAWQLAMAFVAIVDLLIFAFFMFLINKYSPKLFAKMAG
ncbi:MAG: hypothetical protein JXB20_06800 [Bacilli bacterium]|nr:hypothetical protein [Bacilli bacterium]MBN2696717.1 hypothetical protein [Bacilli bacterium]